MKIIDYIKANSFSFVVLLAFVAFLGYRQLTSHITYSTIVDQSAPTFTLLDTNAKSYTLVADDIDKKTILVFWATWCGVCKSELPNLNDIYSTVDPKKFQLISIVVPDNESREELLAFQKQNKIHYPVLIDNKGVYRKYLVKGFPTKFWIDTDGTITDYSLGRSYGLLTQIKNWIDD